MEKSGNIKSGGAASAPSTGAVIRKILFQIKLLVWKRWKESTKSKLELLKVIFPAMLFFSLLLLIYKVLSGLFFPDGAEPFIVPLAFWIYMQRMVVQIMHEKATRLHESMRMMGLSDVAYWTSYFLFDGVFVGFILSFICCLFSTGGLFNDANFGTLLGLFMCFCLSSVTFCFFISAFFDTPQTAGQAVLAVMLGMYVIYIVVFVAGTLTISRDNAEIVCSLFPPLALQIGSGAFLDSYHGIGVQKICGIMVADTFLYGFLAWYVAQVWPSKLGVAKPFYFLLLPSYWLTPAQLAAYFPNKKKDEHGLRQSLTHNAAHAEDSRKVPEEAVDEHIVGDPTVVVNRLRKSYASAGGRVVNNLSLKMYANQIFALLGHNGAGKTTTISMLTGLIAPDFDLFGTSTTGSSDDGVEDNDATVYGHSMRHEMDAIRSSLGVCPQHDVLFDRLTVAEHIIFFSLLKSSTLTTNTSSLDATAAVPAAPHDPFTNAASYASMPTFNFADAEAEASALTSIFHLQHRRNHTGSELSGGQKRKLSVAIAICGGSKFIVLDEPTAGMDPLARRELWDLLSNLRNGRTMLLTTHYMDEADVLGDRVGIMSHGQMLCCGSTPFLKRTFGAGYQVIFDRDRSLSLRDETTVKQLVSFLQEQFPATANALEAVEVKRVITEEEETFLKNVKSLGVTPNALLTSTNVSYPPLIIALPFHASRGFGKMFTALEGSLEKFRIAPGSFGVTITSLEDVFLRVGAAHDNNIPVLDGPDSTAAKEIVDANETTNNGPNHDVAKLNDHTTALMKSTKAMGLSPHLVSQIMGIMWRRLRYAMHDFVTIPLVALPIVVAIAAAVLYHLQVVAKDNLINDLVVSGMYIGAYLGAPGLIAEFLVRERSDKLRTVLTVMGCKFSAYWVGTFLADFLIMSIPTAVIFITWFAAGMTDFIHGDKSPGLCFFLMILFNIQMIAFSYFFSGVFSVPKSCISLMPIIVLLLIISPMVVLLIIIEITITAGTTINTDVIAGVQLWGIMLTTPHGALFTALLDSAQDYSSFINQFPQVGATIFFMIFESVLYLGYAYYADSMTVANVERSPNDPTQKLKALDALDEDVKEERRRTEQAVAQGVSQQRSAPTAGASSAPLDPESGLPLQLRASSLSSTTSRNVDLSAAPGTTEADVAGASPLIVDRLRKVFPPKSQASAHARGIVAVEDVMFSVQKGEIFGLLGANGAGKTTTLSMLTRHLLPTAGDAFIAGHSILTDFTRGAGHMGVVTQSNSLWDRLSVQDHLYLFARLRGVPAQLLNDTVSSTLQNLELWAHRDKLAMSLSGGMKRKLCVAIALIGDPEVVLLDEPSAGLDPVSRRNLWRVILTTMANRAVILTTHSMEEAEALCRRIGIMVLGQMRCLGSKQHLKNKFGSGFELTVKLLSASPASAPPVEVNKSLSPFHDDGESKGTDAAAAVAPVVVASLPSSVLDEKVQALHKFLALHFPSVTQIAQNGSLLTFQIPRDEMRLGLAFTVIEAQKEALDIEDYVIAQPTLEQVFIRTVRRYTPDDNKKKSKKRGGKRKQTAELNDVPMTLGGSVRMSMEGTRTLGDLEHGADQDAEASKDLGNMLRSSIMSLTGKAVEEEDDGEYDEDDEEEDDLQPQQAVDNSFGGRLKYLCCDSADRNKLGCTNFCVKMMALIAGVIALIFIVSAFAEGASGQYQLSGFLWTLGIISIIVSCCGCNILCCACCQFPKDIE